ncbi:hypothetical protein Tco_0286001 [Tanacetum coccineum]
MGGQLPRMDMQYMLYFTTRLSPTQASAVPPPDVPLPYRRSSLPPLDTTTKDIISEFIIPEATTTVAPVRRVGREEDENFQDQIGCVLRSHIQRIIPSYVHMQVGKSILELIEELKVRVHVSQIGGFRIEDNDDNAYVTSLDLRSREPSGTAFQPAPRTGCQRCQPAARLAGLAVFGFLFSP